MMSRTTEASRSRNRAYGNATAATAGPDIAGGAIPTLASAGTAANATVPGMTLSGGGGATTAASPGIGGGTTAGAGGNSRRYSSRNVIAAAPSPITPLSAHATKPITGIMY